MTIVGHKDGQKPTSLGRLKVATCAAVSFDHGTIHSTHESNSRPSEDAE